MTASLAYLNTVQAAVKASLEGAESVSLKHFEWAQERVRGRAPASSAFLTRPHRS
jgi:hypothetical protein